MTEYCPDCITQLKKESKKLGQYSVWMVCPSCGFRKRPHGSNYEADNLSDRIKKSNDFNFERGYHE